MANNYSFLKAKVRNSKWLFCLVALLVLVIANGCGGGNSTGTPAPPTPTPTPAATLQTISVSSPTSTVAAGLTLQFTATGGFSDGTSKPLTSVTWSSSDTTLATVSVTGLATTLKQGSVTISASSAAIKGNTSLVVGPAQATGLVISPAAPDIILGAAATTQLSALVTFTDSSTVDVSTTATWSSSNSTIATVNSTGAVTPARLGYTRITAISGAFTATADAPVVSVPRYLYVPDGTGRTISKGIIGPVDGHVRMAGYITTQSTNGVFPCATVDPTQQFLYVASSINNNGALSGEVQMYKLDPATGALNSLFQPAAPLPISTPSDCIEFEPTGKFGYSSDAINGSTLFNTFARDTVTGMLTLQTTTNLNVSPGRPAIDPFGKYMYLTAFGPGATTAFALGFSIDSTTGALTAIPGTPFALTDLAGSFSFDPSGQFVYLSNSGGLSIDTYSIDRATGILTAAGSIGTCINPTALRFSANGKFAYLACSMNAAHAPASASVESFSVSATGALTHIGSTPSADAPFDLATDPSGQFLYLSANTPNVYSFQIGADGVATFTHKIGVRPNAGFTVVAVGGPAAVQYTPTFAYVSSTGDNKLTTYGINTNGTLSAPSSVIPTQLSPFSLSLLPGTDLLLASSAAAPSITPYSLAPVLGNPLSQASFGVASTAGGIAIDPSGQWAFETDSTNNVVTTYEKGLSSFFLLTYLPANQPPFSTFATGAGPGAMAVDPSGRFLYVANQVGNSISAYQYFGTSPELLESTGIFVNPFPDGSPFPIGAKPVALTVDPVERFLYVVCNDQTLRVFAIDYFSGGHIAQVSSAPLLGQPSALAAEASGRFVYTADSNGVSAFKVDSQTGALTRITLPTSIAPADINGVYVEPSGNFLYVTTSTPNVGGTVLGFSINADGTLTAMSGNPLATPNQPSSMVFAVDIK